MTELHAGPQSGAIGGQPWQHRVAISASTKINPRDFGLSGSATVEGGVILVGGEVILTFEVEFVKACILSGKHGLEFALFAG